MRFAALTFALASAFAQGGFEGVRSGLLYDPPTASIRFVEGVPGAAFLGLPILEGVQAASISPSGQAALARTHDVWVAVRNLDAERPEMVDLGVEVQQARWSPGSKYVAVWRADGLLGVWDVDAGVWTNLVQAGDDGQLAGVSVTDEGTLLAAWFDGQSTRLTSLEEGAWQEMGRVRGRGAIACGSAIAALVGEGEIAVFQGKGEIWRKSTGREEEPIGAEIVGNWIGAAFGGEKPELVFWMFDGKESRLALETAPDRLEALAGSGGFLLKLREQKGEEIWVAARRGNEWLSLFIPAGE